MVQSCEISVGHHWEQGGHGMGPAHSEVVIHGDGDARSATAKTTMKIVEQGDK